MTEYRYRWVSAILRGEPDTAAAEKALKKGWEPVGVIPPEIEPLTGLTMEQTLRGMALYRMPENEAAAKRATLAALNKETMRQVDEHYMREQGESRRVIAEPLGTRLQKYFAPEMLALYPDRQKELDDYAAGPKNEWLLQAIKDYEEFKAAKIADKPVSG